MKKLYLVLLLLACSLGLFAQSGLFNLSYAILATEADSILALSNFESTAKGINTITYTPTNNELVSAIILFIEPKTERMIGWFIKYNPDNTEENDDYVLQTLQQMHGEKNHMDEETQQLIWFLSTTRTVHVMYAEDNSLTVLYYDSHFQELFKAKDDVPEVKLQPLEPGIYGYPGEEEPEIKN